MNKTLIVNQREAEELLTMDSCMIAMEECLKDVSQGTTSMLQRTMLHHENGNILAGMASSLHQKNITGSKVIIFPGAETKKQGTNQGIVPIFNIDSGRLVAIVDAECITGVRTAATSAVATRLLAREDSKTLGILGAGRLGRLHVDAIKLVRDIQKVTVWDLNPEASLAFSKYVSEKHGIEVVVCDTAKQAVVDADIICTVTQAKEPILLGEWIKPGTHINAVGACSGMARELDTNAVIKSRVYCDKIEAVLRDAGDLVIPLKLREITEAHILGEIGQVLMGKLDARQTEEEITMFETVGIAVEDLAAAWLIYERAVERGIGVEVEI